MEPLEPRILYSADLTAGLMPVATPVESPEQRLLDPNGGFVDPATNAASVVANTHTSLRELLFIDAGVANRAALIDALTREQAQGRAIEIIEIGAGEDGIARIGQVLAGRSGIDAVHLLSHGGAGEIRLGNVTLDQTTLAQRGGEIAAWSAALAANADLLIYGCDVAAGSAGEKLVGDLAALTGADVAASTDATGSALLGGNWVLEQASGPIEATVAVDSATQQAWVGLLGIEFQVNTTTSNDQTTAALNRGSQQAVALDAAGNFVVVWSSQNQDGNRDGVYARRFAANGTPLTGEVLVNTTTAGAQNQARVASDTAGNFVVTWTSDGQDGNQTGVYARRFAANGTALTGEIAVNTTTTGAQANSVIGMNRSTGAFVVAWQGQGSGDSAGIFFRRFSANGGAIDATELGANTADAGNEQNPAVAMDSTGAFVIAFDVNNHTYFQRFNAGGIAQGGLTQVDTPLSSNGGAAIAMDAAGNFTIVYRENSALVPGVWGRGFNADGTQSYFFFYVDSGDATSPSIAMADDGRFIVTYEKTGSDNLDVRVRKFAANGSPEAAAFSVHQYVTSDQQQASIALRDMDNFVVVWSGKSAADSNGVVAKVFEANLAPTATSLSSAETYAEDTPLNLADIVVTDLDSGSVTVTLSLSDVAAGSLNTGTAGTVTSTYVPGTGVWRANGPIAGVNSLLAGLIFTPGLNYNSGFSIASSVSDGVAPALTGSKAMTGTAINDAPVGTSKTVTTNEDTAYTFSVADFGFTDPNDAPANTLANVKVTTLPGAGSLTLSGAAVAAGQFVSAANIGAGNLRFTPAANAGGTGYAAFTFQVQDNGGVTGGGVDLDVTARSMTVNVTALNDAPVGTSKTVTTNEDTAYTFTVADFGFTDPNDTPANTLASVKVTTLPGAGTLKNNGVNVTTGQVVSRTDINTGKLVFTPLANANGAGYASFTFQVSDNGGTADGGVNLDATPRTMTVNVTAVNDAPTSSLPSAQNIASNNPLVFSALGGNPVSVADIDAGTSPVQIALTAANGVLTLNGTAGLTFSIGTGSGDSSMTLTGTVANIDAALNGLRFDPTFGFSGSTTFTVGTNDLGNTGVGGPASNAGSVIINVSFVNTAPVLSGANNLAPTLEDLASDSGTAVTALLLGQVSDPDPGAFKGIAVTAVDNSNGAWQYSIDNGGAWNAFGSPATGAARLLAADANTFIRFQANANWNGTVASGLTFRAWDQTSGAAGNVADTTVNGGASAFSAALASADVVVGGVNDAPVSADGSVTTLEDAAYTFSFADFGFTDPADAPANALTAVKIVSLASAGVLANNGAAVAAGQFISATDIALGRLVFTPVANANGAGYAAFTFQVQDDGGTSSSGIDLDTLARTMNIDVTPVNDAPIGTSTTLMTLEDAAYTFSVADFSFTGVDAPANALAAVKIAALPGTGSLTNNGAAVAAGQFISAADIALGRLVFTPVANANGAAYAAFTFQVRDDGGTSSGGVDLDTVARTMSIDVTPVNDAPTGASTTVTTLEDAAYTFSVADFGFTDPADAPANALAAVKFTTLPGTGSLTNNGAAVAAGQFVSAADIALGRLVFAPAANANGAAYAAFTFQVKDDGGTGNGGVDVDAIARTLTIDVTAVNDAPVGADSNVSTQTGATFTFATTSFSFTDPLDAPANMLAAVDIVSLPASGSLSLDGAPVAPGQIVTTADIGAGKLRLTVAGAGSAAFLFLVRDSGGTANGGADTDPAQHTMTVTVATAVAPVVAPAAPMSTGAQAGGASAADSAPVAALIAPAAPVPAAANTTAIPAAVPAAASRPAGTSAPANVAGSDSGAPETVFTRPTQVAAPVGNSSGPETEARTVRVSFGAPRGATLDPQAVLFDAGGLGFASRVAAGNAQIEQFLTSMRAPGFIDELDRLREQSRHEFDLEHTIALSATGVTFGLSVAYVFWMIRSGVLMGSLLSALPAWRVLDPLPVLSRPGGTAGDDDGEPDDDSAAAPENDVADPVRILRGY